MSSGRSTVPHDWYGGSIPENVELGPDTFLESTYALAGFASTRRPGLRMSAGAGIYGQTALWVGPDGMIDIGAYACLNSVVVICNETLRIGAHALLAWGVVITDSWPAAAAGLGARREAMLRSSADPQRPLPTTTHGAAVTIEDAAWVGFGSVILPGVTLGHGCVVGAHSVVREDVPPYAVVAGDPPRLLRWLDRDDEVAHGHKRDRVTNTSLGSHPTPRPRNAP